MKTSITKIFIAVSIAGVLGSQAFVPLAHGISTNSPVRLQMNFRDVPLTTVLEYLSGAAGMTIMLDSHIGGNVTIASPHEVTPDVAVSLLNTELNKQNYTAIRDGLMLSIVTKQEAKTSYLPVKVGNDPGAIPNNDELATWIIPIRFNEAAQLVTDLSPFVSPDTTIIANESGNLIIVTDTQSQIRHLAKLIQAVDSSAQTDTQIQIFPMKYANPSDVLDVLNATFPDTSNAGDDAFMMFDFNPGGADAGRSSADRIKVVTKVVAVAELRTQSLIVSAPKDLMKQIKGLIGQLDVPTPRDQKVVVFNLEHGDPEQVAAVLQAMFQSGTSGASSSSTETSVLAKRAQAALTTTSTTSTGVTGLSY